MPAKFDSCVQKLMAEGKTKDEAYAICTAQFKKASEEDIVAYTRSFEMPVTILSTISVPVALQEFDEKDFEAKKTIDVEVLRSGKFQHPAYGTIEFDEKKFTSFIHNFKSGIPQEYIAYDFKHRPDWGAAAWVKKLFSKAGKLFAKVELTKRGFSSLKDKEFIYFSTEYDDDYTCKETGKKYGATILGGGLTNRPFIKGMAPIMLSEEGEEVFSPIAPGVKKKKKLSIIQTKGEAMLLGKLKEHLEALKAKIGVLVDEEKTIEKADLEEMTALVKSLSEGLGAIKLEDLKDEKDAEKLAELSEQVKSLGERVGKIKVEDKNGDSKLEKLSKRLESFERKLSSIDLDEGKVLAEENAVLKAQVLKLEDGNTKLGDAVKKLQERNEATDKILYETSIRGFTKELEDAGFWPSTCKEAGAILEAYSGRGSVVVKLSEVEGEGDNKKSVEKSLSLQEVIRRILETVPAESRVDLTEKTKAPKGERDTGKKKLTVADIEKIATERKITYAQAVIQLSSEQEYKDLLDV